MLLQNRTISMILTIPQVKELISHADENLEKKFKQPSIPIYHGTIIRIEKHPEDENISDLIVRVPNFHHVSLADHDQLSETESQREARNERPAPICPICPIRNDSNQPLSNAKRLAIGLRNLSRAFKSKQAANMNQIAIIPVVPDVEVITEKFEIPTITKEKRKTPNSTSKFLTPKILFIKRKHFKIKRKQQSSDSVDTHTDAEDNTNTNLKDSESIKPDHDGNINSLVEQQSVTISQLIPNIPISLVDPESSSTHPYSTISGHPPASRITMPDNDTPTTFISNAKIDLRTDIQEQSEHYDDNIEESVYVVHDNGDAYSETYEITYELDPEYRRFIEQNKQQIYLPEIKEQPSVKFNVQQYEYEDLASALSNWIPILPKIPSNTYEQIELDNSDQTKEESIIPVKLPSHDDLSQTSHDQSSTYQTESSNLDDTPMINEDYTVILEFLKHALQIDTTTNDEFNKQLEQLLQTDKINELE